MNGWDALKTGRRMRQKGGEAWLAFALVQFNHPFDPNKWVTVDREALDKDDWEVEPRSVEVTRETLAKAWDASKVRYGYALVFDEFCRALGLEP